MNKGVITLLILTCFAGAGTYTLSYYESQFTFEVDNGFDRIKAEGLSPIGEAGSPELPAQSLVFLIPNGTRVDDIEILSSNLRAYDNTYDIYPLQPQHGFDEPAPPWVPQNSDIYNEDALYPNNIVRVTEHGRIDGNPVVSIVVAPMLYNPVQDSLYLVEDVTFSLSLEPDKHASRPRIRSQKAHEMYEEHIQGSVYNNWEFYVCYSDPDQVVPFADYGTDHPEPRFYDVIIASPPALVEALEPLETWLFEKGIPAKIVTTDWIYSHYDGVWDTTDYAGMCWDNSGDNAAKIKEFLYDSWFNDGTCCALLVGTQESGMPYRQLPGSEVPTDMYYQDFDGRWCGSWWVVSRFEEIWVGRIPAWDYDQAASWVYKRLAYEKNPANLNELDKALWICQDNEPMPYGWQFQSLMDTTIQITEFDQYMEQHKVVGHPGNSGNHGLIDTLNKGYGFCSHYGHGAGDAWKTKYYASDPKELLVSWDWTDYPSYEEFRNEDEYYVVWSLGCATAWYDTVLNGSQNFTGWDAHSPLPCCAEGFVSWYDEQWSPTGDYPLGAVAYDGDVRGGSPDGLKMHRNYVFMLPRIGTSYDNIKIGTLHARQKYAPLYGADDIDIYYSIIRHLFGSPEMPVWQGKPNLLANEHASSIREEITSWITVTVYDVSPDQEDTLPLQNATVVLYKGVPPAFQVFEVARTDGQGNALFSVTCPSPGWLKVTSTARGHVPCQTQIRVKPKFGGITKNKVIEEDTLTGGRQSNENKPNLVFGMSGPTITKTLKLRYTVPETQNVRLDVYDITGSRIDTQEGVVKPGVYEYGLEGLSSGVYVVLLRGAEEKLTRRILVIK